MIRSHDKEFAALCSWLQSRGFTGYTRAGQPLTIYKKEERRHRAFICTQPGCEGSAFCPNCELKVVRITHAR